MAETTVRPAAKKTAKKTAARKTSAKTTASKTTTRKTTAAEPATPEIVCLPDRQLKAVLEDAGYATAGILGDVVEYAKDLPTRIDRLRDDAGHLVEDAPERVKGLRDVPEKTQKSLADLRERLQDSMRPYLQRFDAKADEGRKLAEDIRKDERIDKVLTQAGNARSQLKGAFTSVTKTADVAVETAHEQTENVTTEAKATATTARKGVDHTVAKAKGTATAAKGAAEKTVEATAEQAEQAKRQTKAAATSVKKTAEAAGDA